MIPPNSSGDPAQELRPLFDQRGAYELLYYSQGAKESDNLFDNIASEPGLVRMCISDSVRVLIAAAVRSRCGQATFVRCTSLLLHPETFPAVRHFWDWTGEEVTRLRVPATGVLFQTKYTFHRQNCHLMTFNLTFEDKLSQSDRPGA